MKTYQIMIDGKIYSEEYEEIEEAIEYACFIIDSSYIGFEEWCVSNVDSEYNGETYDYKEPVYVIVEVED